ncbi:transcription factor bHLH93 [Cynara cardunculus var. scolymus]|nr:transcription factor bHLH93 [Cynara cardunculus var. scolymus]
MMQHPSSQPQGLLEDLLTPIKQSLTTFPNVDPGLFWDTSYNEEDDSLLASSSSSFLQLISSSIEPSFQCSSYTGETVDFPAVLPNLDSFTPGNVSNSSSYGQQVCEYEYEYEHEYENDAKVRSMVSVQEGYPTMVTQEDVDGDDKIHEEQQRVVSDNQIPVVFRSGEKKRSKKVEGQPSKNLMAERRRRKRLNDRLSMLRSIVPRISKMDRTSILGDTIEYMKDLLEKIHNFQDHDMGSDLNSLNLMGSFKDSKTNEVQARNPPKFEVERRNNDTRIQICCSSKPGLLVSTLNTLEALGLDIQQCVISSFSDFSLQASCSEAQENRAITSSEDIKQILFRNAGYGGRCL